VDEPPAGVTVNNAPSLPDASCASKESGLTAVWFAVMNGCPFFRTNSVALTVATAVISAKAAFPAVMNEVLAFDFLLTAGAVPATKDLIEFAMLGSQ
jgi:hypothetical protein